MSILTVVQIRSFKPKDRPYTVADGGGLSLHVAPSGVFSWRYRYRFNRKATTLVIGQYPDISLAEARKLHKDAKSLLRDGINPTAAKKERRLEKEKIAAGESINKENSFPALGTLRSLYPRTLCSMQCIYRLGYHSRATVHGFRAVFSTIANESELFDKDAIERQLAHQERNRVRAAYHKSVYLEQRREMMQWWADLIQNIEC